MASKSKGHLGCNVGGCLRVLLPSREFRQGPTSRLCGVLFLTWTVWMQPAVQLGHTILMIYIIIINKNILLVIEGFAGF